MQKLRKLPFQDIDVLNLVPWTTAALVKGVSMFLYERLDSLSPRNYKLATAELKRYFIRCKGKAEPVDQVVLATIIDNAGRGLTTLDSKASAAIRVVRRQPSASEMWNRLHIYNKIGIMELRRRAGENKRIYLMLHPDHDFCLLDKSDQKIFRFITPVELAEMDGFEPGFRFLISTRSRHLVPDALRRAVNRRWQNGDEYGIYHLTHHDLKWYLEWFRERQTTEVNK